MKQKKLAINIPGFKEIIDEELNRELNISELYAFDYKTKIKIMTNDNIIIERTVDSICRNLIKNNGKYILDTRQKELAKNIPGFMDIFDPIINKGINLEQLWQGDSRTKINIKLENGSIITRQVCSICNNLNKNNGIFIPALSRTPAEKYAMDVKGFIEIFNQELNPNIDINQLLYTDNSTILIAADNRVFERTVYSICRNLDHNNGIFKPRLNCYTGKKKYAKDIPGFTELFNPKLNKDIDLETLSKNDKGTMKIDVDGKKIIERRISTVCKNLIRNNGIYKDNRRNNGIYKDNRNKSLKRRTILKVREKYAKDVPGFMELFDKSLNQDIDIDTLTSNSTKKIYFYNKEGTVISRIVVNLCRNLSKNKGHFVERPKVIQGVNDAETLDPELALFWGNNKKKANEISPYTGHQYNFLCPYCGYEFRKAIKNVAMKNPKCPQCHDTGFENKNTNNMPSNVAFLLRSLKDEL